MAGNEERLKELHAKQQYLQEDARKTGFEAGGIIGADEYVYFLFGIMRGFYAVTEKRLLKYLHPRFGEPRLTEFTWSEVAAATLVTQRDMGGVRYELQIQTLKGRVDLHFSVRDGQFASRFQREVANALNRHNMGQRDVRALIWSYHPS